MFKKKKTDLFPKFLTGTTMQDGGTRERRNDHSTLEL